MKVEMAFLQKAPKQWSLTKNETITSFEAWRVNLHYVLSLDANFAPFLTEGFSWSKSSSVNPIRGLVDDVENVQQNKRRTTKQVL